MLLAEIRFEHREALGETWHAWVPLVYVGVLIVLGAGALLRYHEGGRRVLRGLFGLAFLVGALGVWFHSDGHPVQALGSVAAAWWQRPEKEAGESRPPALAPAAFIGIGLIGVVACRRA